MAPLRSSAASTESGLERFFDDFENWSDGVSLILLVLAYLVLDLNPRRYLWRSPRRSFFRIAILAILAFWSGFRFFAEALYDAAGPREFWVVTIIYVARWLWLAVEWVRRDRCRKWLKVVRELRRVKAVRAGTSTSDKRKGDVEIVVRKAVKKVSSNYRTGENSYWRGYEVKKRHIENKYAEEHGGTRINKRWLVYLEDEHRLMDDLEPLLNRNLWKDDIGGGKNVLYKKIYDVVLTSFPKNLKDTSDNTWCAPFKSKWDPLSPEYLARETNALDDSLPGHVARKMASDAVFYVFQPDGKYRLPKQIDAVNLIFEKTAKKLWREVETNEANGPRQTVSSDVVLFPEIDSATTQPLLSPTAVLNNQEL